MAALDGAKTGKTSWISLYTGRTGKVLKVTAGKNRTVFTLPSKAEDPGLLILKKPSGAL